MLRKGMFISDRYEIIDKVGSGGMSDVYKAKCHKLNRYVAIKVLKPEFNEDKNFVSKFKVEAQSAAGLSHPNIVNVFDVGEDNGLHYIVMELIEGITLKKYIERKGKLPIKEAVSILVQVSQGIEAAHNNHIIHRDIKPQNIIISKEGKVKVTDFGIARAASTNTISSNAMGSVHYISPEQAKGGFIDEKSDIYSLGITLYEMVTGRVPFEGDSTVAIALQHVQNELPSPKIYVPDLPISVEKIIEKCTQKKPDRRYLKVSSLIADLKHSLIAPDEDFVQISTLDENAATRMLSDEEVSKIRKESGFERPELDIPVIGKDNDLIDLEDEDEDEVQDDLVDELGEDNPKLDKIIAIGGIVTGVIIFIIVAFVLISFLGNGCGSSKKDNETTKTEGETTLDAKHTKVPDVVGKKQDDAVKAIKDATLGSKIETDYDNTVEEGCVISTSPEAGTVVEKNSTVIVKVSKGPKAIEIPDLTGKDKNEAKKTLEDLDLTVKLEYQPSSDVEMEKVISTDPKAPTQVKAGDTITVYISSGSDSKDVTVPKLIGLTQDAARASLEAQGLKLGEVREDYGTADDKGKVIKQDINANDKAPAGTAVNITISKGKEDTSVKVPKVIGSTKDQAKKDIESAGLTYKESSGNSDTVPEGNVISCDPGEGTSIEKGSAVTVKVSTGSGKKIASSTVKKDYLTGSVSDEEKNKPLVATLIYTKSDSTTGEMDIPMDNRTFTTFPELSINKELPSNAVSAELKITVGSKNGTLVYTGPVTVK